jgi:plastocyanin
MKFPGKVRGHSAWAMIRVVILAAEILSPAPAAALAVSARVVDSSGAPVPEAVIFLPETPGVVSAPPKSPYILDQIDKEFVPHLLPIVVGGEVRFPNRDNIHHHVYSFSRARKFELQLYKGEPTSPVRFDQSGVVKVGCNIHDWMTAVILVLPNAHFAVTDEKGEATLRDLPDRPGLTLQLFHERLKDSVEKTAQTVPVDSLRTASLIWTIKLKAERKRAPPDFGY